MAIPWFYWDINLTSYKFYCIGADYTSKHNNEVNISVITRLSFALWLLVIQNLRLIIFDVDIVSLVLRHGRT